MKEEQRKKTEAKRAWPRNGAQLQMPNQVALALFHTKIASYQIV